MRTVFFIVGLFVLVLAIFDEANIPLEVPTSNNWVNMAVGAGAIGIGLLVFKKSK
jgi:hypothetical protein